MSVHHGFENNKIYNSHKAIFDTYEVIAPRIVHLDNDNVVERIGIGCIVVKVMVRNTTQNIHIKNIFYTSKFLLNGLEVQFNLNEFIMRGQDKEMIVI